MTKATELNTPIPTRRALLAGAPAAAAGALLAGTAVNAVAIGMAKAGEVDPVLTAIEDHKAALAEYYRLFDVLEEAEQDVREEHGHRPIALIQWRNYWIGGAEIDRA